MSPLHGKEIASLTTLRRAAWFCVVVTLPCSLMAGPQPTPELPAVSPSTSDGPWSGASASRALAFAARLAELGPRPAASEGEARARAAISVELEAIGLEVSIEPFEYRTVRLEDAVLDLGGARAEPVVLGLNPFEGRSVFAGEAIVVTDPAAASEAIKDRIVVTNHPLMQLMIAEHDPDVVICVDPADLESFVARDSRDVSLQVDATPLVLQSANVVARLGPHQPGQPEILVTSHVDAYQNSPGANDNGTGLGAMIELARALARGPGRPPVSVVFAAFGAEEHGAIGSRAYLEKHLAELTDAIAVVNLDTLGGARGPVIGTTPSEPAPDSPREVRNRIPDALRGTAWEGPAGRWRMIHPEIIPTALTSDYPDWLHSVVEQSADHLGIEVAHLDLISDHRTFARAGIPAISIQSKEHHIHSEEDTAGVLVPATVDSCVRLATEILRRLQPGDTPARELKAGV